MYFIEKIKKNFKNKELIVFVDMDGVIADYEFGKSLDFKHKRPLMTNINTLKQLSLLDNVEICILSICKTEAQIYDKNNWLNKYAPFFKKRIIISKESNPNLSSKDLKCNYLKKYILNTKKEILIIDDDNEILKYLEQNIKNIYLYQDSSIID